MDQQEALVNLSFPNKGIGKASEFHDQPQGTTPLGQNVRAFDMLKRRMRGGSRSGIRKYIGAQVNGTHLIQHLNTVVRSTSDATWEDYILNADFNFGFELKPLEYFGTFGWLPGTEMTLDPLTGLTVRVGGSVVRSVQDQNRPVKLAIYMFLSSNTDNLSIDAQPIVMTAAKAGSSAFGTMTAVADADYPRWGSGESSSVFKFDRWVTQPNLISDYDAFTVMGLPGSGAGLFSLNGLTGPNGNITLEDHLLSPQLFPAGSNTLRLNLTTQQTTNDTLFQEVDVLIVSVNQVGDITVLYNDAPGFDVPFLGTPVDVVFTVPS